MRRLLSILFLLLAVRGYGAAGDFLGAQIDPQGWQLWLDFVGMQTNGTFSLGLGTNGSVTGSQTVTLSLTSQGFDDAGAATTVQRTLYGTKQIRLAYPAQAYPDVSSNANVTTVKIALSDYVHSGDSNLTLTLSGGLYAQGGTNSAAVISATVTNNSAFLYQKPVANWSHPGFNLISGNTMTLRAVGFHSSATHGRPLRVMRFVAQDEHGVAVTNFVTTMTATKEPLTGLTVCEYIGNMDISGMTQGDRIRCDFTAYPWVGTNTTDTLLNEHLSGPYYCAITNVCDRLGTYGRAYAIVSNGGVDATGVVSSNGTTSWVSPFLNAQTAMNAIAKSNAIWYGAARSNCASSFLYVDAAEYNWWGSGGNTANGLQLPDVWFTVLPYPTNAAWTSILTNGSAGQDRHNKRTKFQGLVLASANATYGLNGLFDAAWLDNCILASKPAMFALATNFTLTSCIVSNPCGSLAAANTIGWLFRDIADQTTNGFVYAPETTLAFKRISPMTANAAGPVVTWDKAVAGMPHHDMPIVAYCDFRGQASATSLIDAYASTYCTNGGALVQNLFETMSGNINLGSFGGGDSSDITNLLVWNNVFEGNRVLFAYNWNGTTTRWRVGWSVKGNIWDWMSIKADVTATGNSVRTGNWAVVYGVMRKGDVTWGATNLNSLPSQHDEQFTGLGSLYTISLATNWPNYAFNASLTAANGPGMGNYRLLSSSPALLNGLGLGDWLLPYDLEGNARGALDPPGAYASASPRKGGLFFAQ